MGNIPSIGKASVAPLTEGFLTGNGFQPFANRWLQLPMSILCRGELSLPFWLFIVAMLHHMVVHQGGYQEVMLSALVIAVV